MHMITPVNEHAYDMVDMLQGLGFSNDDAEYIVFEYHCQSARYLFFMYDDEIDNLEYILSAKRDEVSKSQLSQQVYYLQLACVWVRNEFYCGHVPILIEEISISEVSSCAVIHQTMNPMTHHNPDVSFRYCGEMTDDQMLSEVDRLISTTFGVLQIPLDYLLHQDFYSQPDTYDNFSDQIVIYKVPNMLTKFNIDIDKEDTLFSAFQYDNAELWKLLSDVIRSTRFDNCIIQVMDFHWNDIALYQQLKEAVNNWIDLDKLTASVQVYAKDQNAFYLTQSALHYFYISYKQYISHRFTDD